MGTKDQIKPFGHYALPAAREALRLKADRYSGSRLGRWMISLYRKRAIKGLSEPFDVTVAPHVKARLYPSGNRCEKRALAGVQIWDADERAALRQAITSGTEPFIFLDVGANAGLYSLFAQSYAREAARPIRIIAVEPSAKMSARLSFNAQASDAQVELIRSAISDEPGSAYLSDGGGNLGEGQLGDQGETVTVETLHGLCERLKVARIDAMKVDIEGHDERALTGFFKSAPETLHPKLLTLELSKQNRDRLVALASAHSYLMRNNTSLNGIFEKTTHV